MRWSTLLLVLLPQALHAAHSLNSLNVLLKCHLRVAFPDDPILNLYSPSPSLHAQLPFQLSSPPSTYLIQCMFCLSVLGFFSATRIEAP